MSANFRLFINGEKVTVNGVNHSNNGFVNVFVNGNAGCHSFPAHVLTKNVKFRMSGNDYEIKQGGN